MGCFCVPLGVNFGDFTGEALLIFVQIYDFIFKVCFIFGKKKTGSSSGIISTGDFHW